ncbi:DNA polymerase alpha subunit B [Trichinella pseudospiralis]|uniref:DNA polymerase alpha subunit B n=1 Tax=Trichinella pseudospiralis TaxID=6337 RepID=A0A0V1E5E4_TRIPS|nr:DNA polymerase alpha subunit B [Trichinella pseudospiralis]
MNLIKKDSIFKYFILLKMNIKNEMDVDNVEIQNCNMRSQIGIIRKNDFTREPWASAKLYLDAENISIVTIESAKELFFFDLLEDNKVECMLVTVARIREKCPDALLITVEDQTGEIDAVVKFDKFYSPHNYSSLITAGSVLFLEKISFCGLSKLSPYAVILKPTIRRIYWIQYEELNSAVHMDYFSTQACLGKDTIAVQVFHQSPDKSNLWSLKENLIEKRIFDKMSDLINSEIKNLRERYINAGLEKSGIMNRTLQSACQMDKRTELASCSMQNQLEKDNEEKSLQCKTQDSHTKSEIALNSATSVTTTDDDDLFLATLDDDFFNDIFSSCLLLYQSKNMTDAINDDVVELKCKNPSCSSEKCEHRLCFEARQSSLQSFDRLNVFVKNLTGVGKNSSRAFKEECDIRSYGGGYLKCDRTQRTRGEESVKHLSFRLESGNKVASLSKNSGFGGGFFRSRSRTSSFGSTIVAFDSDGSAMSKSKSNQFILESCEDDIGILNNFSHCLDMQAQSTGNIFRRRQNLESFRKALPRSKINGIDIKLEDDCPQGNDETRLFVLTNLGDHKRRIVTCIICQSLLPVYDRYPLIDGTFFLSPINHENLGVMVNYEGSSLYLLSLCMYCMESAPKLMCILCGSVGWFIGNKLIYGTLYTYDVLAAVQCCMPRCSSCYGTIPTAEEKNLFSRFSEMFTCPHCSVNDYHFIRRVNTVIVYVLCLICDIETVKIEDIVQQFSYLGFVFNSADDVQVCNNILRICSNLKWKAEEFVDQWISFSLSNSVTEMNVENLNIMERNFLRNRRQEHCGQSSPRNTFLNDSKISEISNSTFEMSKELLSTYITSDQQDDSAIEDVLENSQEIGLSSPNAAIVKRSSYAKLIFSYQPNVTLEWIVPEMDRYITVRPFDCKQFLYKSYRYMYEKLEDRMEMLGKMIDSVSGAVMRSVDEGKDVLPVDSVSDEMIYICGQVYSVSGLLKNNKDVHLHGKSDHGFSEVTLDLSSVKQYAIFPGQIIVAKGVGLHSHIFAADEIYPGELAPIPVKTLNEVVQCNLLFVIACGPFCYADENDFIALQELVNYCLQVKASTLILIGPIFYSENIKPLSQDDVSYEELLCKMLFNICESLSANFTNVIIVASPKDTFSSQIYPCPPYRLKWSAFIGENVEQPDNLFFAPDPCLLNVGGVIIGITSTDILWHLKNEELVEGIQQGERVNRMITHLLMQRSFYPLCPSGDITIEYNKLKLYGELSVRPDILILPSKFHHFIKSIHKTVCVNPGNFVKAKSTGTFVTMKIFMDQLLQRIDDFENCVLGEILRL